jgi:TrmH family RNA methyltransferase
MIESKDNPQIKGLIKLMKTPKKQFVVQGYNLINEAIKSNQLIKLYHLPDEKIPNGSFQTEQISLTVAYKISDVENGSPIFGLCNYKESIIDFQQQIIVLEKIQDPGNLGNIIRTLAALNIKNLILINCVNPYNQKVLRSAMGGHFYLNIVSYNDSMQVINLLKEKTYQSVGLSLTGEPLSKFQKVTKTAFWFGNEGNGLSKSTQAKMDQNLLIPITNVESLNVGTTVAIVAYTLK